MYRPILLPVDDKALNWWLLLHSTSQHTGEPRSEATALRPKKT